MIAFANRVVVETVRVAQVIIFIALGLVAYYAADREPPFAVIEVYPAAAKPGEYVTLHAKVRRDVSRKCNAEFSRYLYDSSGSRFDLGHSLTSAEMIDRLESKSPGVLTVSFMLPQSMAAGPADLQTVLAYTCNRIHNFFPIIVTSSLPFEVLP